MTSLLHVYFEKLIETQIVWMDGFFTIRQAQTKDSNASTYISVILETCNATIILNRFPITVFVVEQRSLRCQGSPVC